MEDWAVGDSRCPILDLLAHGVTQRRKGYCDKKRLRETNVEVLSQIPLLVAELRLLKVIAAFHATSGGDRRPNPVMKRKRRSFLRRRHQTSESSQT